jgi:uncharacterized protein HemX
LSDEKSKNGRLSLATAISLVVAVASIGGSWFVWGQQTGRLTEKVETLEKRQAEDRATFRRDQGEIKNDVKEVKQDVQTILRKLDSMDAAQRAREGRGR